jgi:hypothetical protein
VTVGDGVTVSVGVGLGVIVGVSVKVGLGVIVGPRNCPGPQPESKILIIKIHAKIFILFAFIISPALSRVHPMATKVFHIPIVVISQPPNGSHYRRQVGLDSFAKRKCSTPEPTCFDGVNPAVRVHALLRLFIFKVFHLT